jgi:hypothetical protein
MQRSARNQNLARLHALKREMALDEDAYRDRLFVVAGVRSAKQLDDAALAVALAKFPVKQSNTAFHAHHRLAKALWIACWNLGALASGDDAALDAFVRRQTGKERLAFVTPAEAGKVTEALKGIAGRQGFEVPPSDEGGMKAREALLYAQWRRMAALGLVRIDQPDALDRYVERTYLTFHGAVCHMQKWQMDELARKFGARIRKAALPSIAAVSRGGA